MSPNPIEFDMIKKRMALLESLVNHDMTSTMLAEEMTNLGYPMTKNAIIGLCRRKKWPLKFARPITKPKQVPISNMKNMVVHKKAIEKWKDPKDFAPRQGTKPMIALDSQDCRWACGDQFCAQTIHSGAYCQEHAVLSRNRKANQGL